MFRAHKIRIDCTKEQHSLLMQTAGCARYAYNWGLEKWGKMYEARKADSSLEEPNWVNISRQWTQEKPEWANKTARSAVTCSLSNLGTAFNNFIKHKTPEEAQEIPGNLLPAWKRYLQYRRQPHQAAYHRLRKAQRNSTLPRQNHRLHSTAHRISLVRDSRLRLSRRT